MDIFDPDQTHDRLFAQRINQTCIDLIAGKLGDHSPFEAGKPFPVVLVEREAPGNPKGSDQWASNWSENYFDILLKPLSRTFILTDGYLNGSAYGFEPEYTADLSPSTMDSVWGTRAWPDEIKITVPQGKTAQISWIEKAHPEVKSAPFCDKVTNKISVWMRRTILLTAPPKEALEWIMPPGNANYLLHNSLVITGHGTLETTPVNGLDLVRAQNLSMVCYLCLNGLALPAQCRVLTKLTVEITETTQFAWATGSTRSSGSFISAGKTWKRTNPFFQTTPDWFNNAYMEKEGESWGNLTYIHNEENQITELAINKTYSLWDEFQAKRLSGEFDAIQLIFTETPTENFNWFEDNPIGNGAISYSVTLPIIGFFLNPDPLPTPLLSPYSWNRETIELFLAPTRNDVLIPVWQLNYPFPPWFSNRHRQVINEATGETYMVPNLVNVFRLPDSDNHTLFSSGTIGLISSGFSQNRITPVSGVSSIILKSRSGGVRIVTTLSNDLLSVDLTTNNEISGDEIIRFDSTLNQFNERVFGDDILAPIQSTAYFTLNRNLRSYDSLEYPTLFLIPIDSSIPVLYFGQSGETKLTEILYPDGINEPSILDPATDNGDIMPDSIRLKEIHAALEADRYGVHPGDPEKKRLNNLGQFIEAAAYVLGINFDSDGNNLAYPDAQLLPPEKIEEVNNRKILKNAQFAVANVNGKFDSSSLYEVRSALFRTGDGDTTVDQRPYAVKYHNLPQLIDAMADDTSKQLGGGKNSIFQVPNANGDDFQQYEGIFQPLADSLYMLSGHGKAINELQNQSIKTVYMLGQILKAMGVPMHVEKLPGTTGVYDKEGNEIPGFLAVPGLDPKSPTLVGLMGIVLMNLQRVVGSSIGYRTDEPTEEDKSAKVTIKASPKLINAKNGGQITFTVTRATKTPEAKDELIFVNLMVNSTLGKDAFDGDFKPGLWSLDLPPGETSKSFYISVEKQETLKENHNIAVILSGGEGYELGEDKSATVVISPGEEEEEKNDELPDSDWMFEIEDFIPKPDFIPDLTEDN